MKEKTFVEKHPYFSITISLFLIAIIYSMFIVNNSNLGEDKLLKTTEEICIDSGGNWEQFSNGCADGCDAQRTAGYICTQAFMNSCNCGEGQCWTGTSCEPI